MFSSPGPGIRLLTRTSARKTVRFPVSRGLVNLSVARNARPRFTGTTRFVFGTVLLASFALTTTRVYADAQAESSNFVSAYGIFDAINLLIQLCGS